MPESCQPQVSSVTLNKSKLLLAEGKEDVRVFEKLLEEIGVNDIQVLKYDGKNNLGSYLRALMNVAGFEKVEKLGITRDADTDHDAAFRSVCGALQRAGLSIPKRQYSLTGTNPAVAIMILPSINQPGMLEDVFLQTLDASVINCVNGFVTCMEQLNHRSPNLSKSKVYTFLDIKNPDCRSLGNSTEAGFWQLGHPAFNEMKRFFTIL
jgi:hypothetical protein